MSLALLPPRTDRRLKNGAKQKVEPPPHRQKAKKSAVLRELFKKQAQLAAIGVVASLWSLFAPLVNIQTSGTVKPFEPYDYQIDLIQTIELNQNTVICKSRQMGISETICSYLLMRSLTEPGFSAVVFSKTQADASELGRRIRDMALSLGDLCPVLTSESVTRLEFKGLGRIHFLPVTPRSARGIPSVSVVVFDEAAFIDNIESIYQAAIPTLSMLGDRGKVIFNSTPNGRTGLFYRLLSGGAGEAIRLKESLDDIRKPANDIKPISRTAKHTRTWEHRKWAKVLLHWRVHPVYGADPDWAEKTRQERQLTEAQWDQEYELSFLEGNRSVFSEDYIARSQRSTWEAPKPRHRYLAGIDTNLGGDDYFTTHVWDITSAPYRLVAEYRQNRRAKDYNIAQSILTLEPYNPVGISVETNNGGSLYLEEFIKLRSNWQWQGVCTTHNSKFTNTDRLVLLLERDQLEMPVGCALASEMGHFVESSNGKTRTRAAESGWHDDTVMASAVCFANLDDAGYSMSDLLAAIAA